jgi:sRNA-binding regulator protein Hfq
MHIIPSLSTSLAIIDIAAQEKYLDKLVDTKTPILVFTQTGRRFKAVVISYDDDVIEIGEMNAPTKRRLLYKVDIAFVRGMEDSLSSSAR